MHSLIEYNTRYSRDGSICSSILRPKKLLNFTVDEKLLYNRFKVDLLLAEKLLFPYTCILITTTNLRRNNCISRVDQPFLIPSQQEDNLRLCSPLLRLLPHTHSPADKMWTQMTFKDDRRLVWVWTNVYTDDLQRRQEFGSISMGWKSLWLMFWTI